MIAPLFDGVRGKLVLWPLQKNLGVRDCPPDSVSKVM